MKHYLATFVALVSASSCAGQPASAPTSPAAIGAPPVAVLAIRNDLSPALGVAGYTPLVFDASASSGTGLSHVIDFGDGSSSSSAVATHVGLEGERSLVARLTVIDSFGRIATAEAPYYLLTVRPQGGRPGGWIYVSGGSSVSLSLVQTGNTLTGEYGERGSTRKDLHLTGTLTSDHDITLRTDDGTVVLEGTFTWRTAGSPTTCASQSCVRLRLSVRGGRADGQVVDFTWADPY